MMFGELQKERWTKRARSCIMLMISCNLSTVLGPRGNNQTCVCVCVCARLGGWRAERGRESLVKWNLVTDASEGSAAPAGEDGGCCACLRGRALMYVHTQYSCVCKIAQEKDRT